MHRFSTSFITAILFTAVFSCSSGPAPEEPVSGQVGQPLGTPRRLLPFVQLADGRVLAAGGHDGTRTLSSCEVFDPATGQWSSTGSLKGARRNHAAVTLPDGRVLVAGGSPQQLVGMLASVELLDPATGEWTLAAPMLVPRIDPTAVLLADGRVLVVGGSDLDRRQLRSAELFDPATGMWAPAEAPSWGHSGAQAAAVLQDGRVLFVSGMQAELFDPSTGRWAKAGSAGGAAGTHRSGHTVTRLADGRVLVVGGSTSRAAETAELFDPATDAWTLVAPPHMPRESHGAVVTADGAVLVVGGYHFASGTLAAAERFDPATSTWSLVTSLKVPRRGAGVVRLPGGEVLLVGGFNDAGGTLASTERYLPGHGCIPATCVGQHDACGVVPDGCGGLLDCGSCAGGQECAPDGCGTGEGVDASALMPVPTGR
ncbi:Kelch repeat-containing protein [Hyalangium sp.]|uniref:Kelch repeat-containing protein n=1 Tax=Hyalangium sp. TaxID=2028555 RepID=UPI002D47EABE|nr:kelch repeat-containing protein [Hyalangium sp.]HYH98899.1 kelch repeat-containing protein [Hyalangium sp.]